MYGKWNTKLQLEAGSYYLRNRFVEQRTRNVPKSEAHMSYFRYSVRTE